jgi:hypothetical protein
MHRSTYLPVGSEQNCEQRRRRESSKGKTGLTPRSSLVLLFWPNKVEVSREMYPYVENPKEALRH